MILPLNSVYNKAIQTLCSKAVQFNTAVFNPTRLVINHSILSNQKRPASTEKLVVA